MDAPKISVIIISYNCRQYVIDCIKSIIMTCYELIPEIIVVDNASSDGTVATLEKIFPDIKIVENSENKGYSAAINNGVKIAEGDYLFLSNADVLFLNSCIYDLTEELRNNKNIGVISPQQEFSNGTWQRSFGMYPSVRKGWYDFTLINSVKRKLEQKRFSGNNLKQKEVEYLDGALLACRKEVFNEAGGFDESFEFYSEESDFCFQLKKLDYKVIHYPDAKIVHHRGGSQQNSGMNPESIYKLISSEYQFVTKNFDKNDAKKYLLLERRYFSLLKSIAKIRNQPFKNYNIYLEQITKVLSEI